MLILFVGLGLGWLPISGHVPVLQPAAGRGFPARPLTNIPDALRHLILPGITLAVFSLSRNARLIRSSMLEVLGQDYVTTARAKGLAGRTVMMRHAFRNALIPFVTIVGLEFGFLLSGVVVIETVFSWPGVGRLVFNAINQRDIPVVQAAVVVFSLLFVMLNLIVDVVYTMIDPRIRLELTHDQSRLWRHQADAVAAASTVTAPSSRAALHLGARRGPAFCGRAGRCWRLRFLVATGDGCVLRRTRWLQPTRTVRT